MDYKGVVRAYFAIVDSRQFDDLTQVFHEEIIYERPGYKPLIGLKRVLNFYKKRRRLASGSHTIEGIIIQGEQAACWGRFVGMTRKDKPVDERFADVFHFKDGKIYLRTTYFYRRAV